MKHAICVGAILTGVAASCASGAIVTIQASGQISEISRDFVEPYASHITVGAAWSVEIVYDSTSPGDELLPWATFYNTAITSYTLTVGGEELLSVTEGFVAVSDDEPWDSYLYSTGNADVITSGLLFANELVSVYDGQELPSYFELSDFPDTFLYIQGDASTIGGVAQGTINAFTIIPAPWTALPFGLLAVCRRRAPRG